MRRARVTAVAATVVSLTLAAATPASAAQWTAVAVWHMDETSGNRMVDAVGHHTGAMSNVKTGLPGLARYAYGYNGKTSRAFIPKASAGALNPGDRDVRLTMWIKTTDKPVRGIDADWDLFRKGYFHRGTHKTLYVMEYHQDGRASCGFSGTKDSMEFRGGPDLADGKWHKLSCTKTARSITLAVDGRTAVTKQVTIGRIANADEATVGAKPRGEFFRGMLDEVVLEMAGPSRGR